MTTPEPPLASNKALMKRQKNQVSDEHFICI
jgi:hypothetical protein